MGRGGDMGLEKPKIYLAMDEGRITIIKCKEWRGNENPNGLSMTFKLVGGSKFSETSLWKR